MHRRLNGTGSPLRSCSTSRSSQLLLAPLLLLLLLLLPLLLLLLVPTSPPLPLASGVALYSPPPTLEESLSFLSEKGLAE